MPPHDDLVKIARSAASCQPVSMSPSPRRCSNVRELRMDGRWTSTLTASEPVGPRRRQRC